MAVIRHTRSGRLFSPPPHCRVGRSPDSDLYLPDGGVSGEHALLSFRPEGWLVRDTGSRNGTWLDGARLPVGSRHVVPVGAVLRFGVEDESWTLVDAAPPGPAAVGPGGRLCVAVGGLLALPDAEAPVLLVYASDGRWVVERTDGESDPETAVSGVEVLGSDPGLAVADGDTPGGARDAAEVEAPARVGPPARDGLYAIGGELWRLLLPTRAGAGPVATTWEESLPPDRGVRLQFTVSRDEEHVDVLVEDTRGTTRLAPRAHHFLTLTLARALLEDDAEGVDPAERGWRYVEDLGNMLRVDQAYLNLQLFRARQQFAEAGVEGAGAVFERRRLSRQVRMRVAGVTVRTG